MKTPENFIEIKKLENAQAEGKQVGYDFHNQAWFDLSKSMSYIDYSIKDKSKSIKINEISYEKISKCEFDFKFIELPLALKDIKEEIEDSKYILDLEFGWEGINSEPINKSIYETATKFLIQYSLGLLFKYKIVMQSPEINPGADGSIDLSWRTSLARLLINIKIIDGKLTALFYRDFYNNIQVNKGEIMLGSIDESFLIWMKNLR